MDMHASMAAGPNAADMKPAPRPDGFWDDLDRQAAEARPEPPQHPAIKEYEARRCHICQCKYPAFGFGPPLTRPGVTLWACGAHHPVLDDQLRGGTVKPAQNKQPSLL